METATKRVYEGLFLVDTTLATSNWDDVVAAITGIIEKRGGEVISLKKWDERKLAYEIQKKNRGTYVLVYFNCITSGISAIERDVVLSEDIMRAMVLRGDHLTEEDMSKATPQELEAKADAKKEAEAVEETTDDSEEDTDE